MSERQKAELALACVLKSKTNKVSCYVTEWEVYWSPPDKAFVISKYSDELLLTIWLKTENLEEIVNEYLDVTGFAG